MNWERKVESEQRAKKIEGKREKFSTRHKREKQQQEEQRKRWEGGWKWSWTEQDSQNDWKQELTASLESSRCREIKTEAEERRDIQRMKEQEVKEWDLNDAAREEKNRAFTKRHTQWCRQRTQRNTYTVMRETEKRRQVKEEEAHRTRSSHRNDEKRLREKKKEGGRDREEKEEQRRWDWSCSCLFFLIFLSHNVLSLCETTTTYRHPKQYHENSWMRERERMKEGWGKRRHTERSLDGEEGNTSKRMKRKNRTEWVSVRAVIAVV